MKDIRKAANVLVAVIVCLVLVACPKTYVQHPGTANVTDSKIYDTLVGYDSAIKQAKADVESKMLTPSVIPIANEFIRAYNVANASYRTYHDAAMAGQDASALLKQLQVDLDAVADALKKLTAARRSKP